MSGDVEDALRSVWLDSADRTKLHAAWSRCHSRSPRFVRFPSAWRRLSLACLLLGVRRHMDQEKEFRTFKFIDPMTLETMDSRRRRGWAFAAERSTEACAASRVPTRTQLRIGRIQNALLSENWLPIGLRSLLAQELPKLRDSLATKRGSKCYEAARERIHELALASFSYGPSLLKSDAVTQLRVLDLELNPVEIAGEATAGSVSA